MTDASLPAPKAPASELDAAGRRLSEIEQALERLEAGSYGRCRSCGREIPDDLLASDPLTEACASCAGATGSSTPLVVDQRD
ncbi:MAG: TraR/DksA family transcriptional regulator [Acidimicrobiales bacterium]